MVRSLELRRCADKHDMGFIGVQVEVNLQEPSFNSTWALLDHGETSNNLWRRQRVDQLSVVCMRMIIDSAESDDVSNRSSVEGEEDRSEDRALRHTGSAPDYRRSMPTKLHILVSFRKVGFYPIECHSSGVATIPPPPRKLLVWASGQEVTATTSFWPAPGGPLQPRPPPAVAGPAGPSLRHCAIPDISE